MTGGERTRRLRRWLEQEEVSLGEEFPCPYLSGRLARHLSLRPEATTPGLYHSFMDLNFRRLGPLFCRPRCQGCDECRMIRVPVAAFRPSRSQRRCWARNADLEVKAAPPLPTEERRALFVRYLAARHDGQMTGSRAEMEMLYRSEVETVEISYRLGGRLLAVGLADLEPEAMSAVYCYFDPPAERRSPGVFNVLWMIAEARRRGLAHLYLGYYVRQSATMAYKAQYRPCEILDAQGAWVPSLSGGARSSG